MRLRLHYRVEAIGERHSHYKMILHLSTFKQSLEFRENGAKFSLSPLPLRDVIDPSPFSQMKLVLCISWLVVI